jgi:hypothetical protein
MLRNKHMILDQEKIDRAKKILGAKTETEVLHRALDKVIQEDLEKARRAKIVKQMLDLRNRMGKMREDPSEWIRLARKERMKSHESRD